MARTSCLIPRDGREVQALTLLATRGLGRRFGGLDALQDVSLEVDEGKIVGVIGPNGAGKTTLINLITGHLKPTRGVVELDGEDVTGRRPWAISHLGVARTFQVVKPFREMTLRENVGVGAMFGRRTPSVRNSMDRADEILERVGLSGKSEALPGELSVADLRRLELGRALGMEPRLLLLDEVLAGLRPREVDEAVELIRSLRDEGITILAVEHVMKAIMTMCDLVFVLHEGRPLMQGTPDQVASDDRVIEAYLGKRYAKRTRKKRDA